MNARIDLRGLAEHGPVSGPAAPAARHVDPARSELSAHTAKTGGREAGPGADLSALLANASSLDGLFLLMANARRAAVGAQQVFVFHNRPQPQIVAISSLPRPNRQSPLVQDLEKVIQVLFSAGELGQARMFSLGAEEIDFAPHLKTYPFRNLAWTPLAGADGGAVGGILYGRMQAWSEAEITDLAESAALFGDRFSALDGPQRPALKPSGQRGLANRKKAGLVAAVLMILAMGSPTTMSVSAPFQVVSRDHLVVSAPLDGVVEDILVRPGEAVRIGQPLVKFVDTERRNQVSIAQREVDLSEAVLKRASQLSFEGDEGRRQLGPSLAEVAIKRAQLKLAQDQSSRATIFAKSAGIAIFSDEKSLIGRPFATGERILDISNPENVEFEISLGVSDSMAMEKGAQVKLFPDNAPLHALDATLARISYVAEPDSRGLLSYRLVAEPDAESASPPKLGTSGTAKIYGRTVPLAFYLFRRPITTVRQWLGV